MANDICILCWKKEATEVFVQGVVRVCKGCQYEVNRVLNFMSYFGYGVGPIDTKLPPEPPTPKKTGPQETAGYGKAKKQAEEKARIMAEAAAKGKGTGPTQLELPGTPLKPQ